MEVTAPIPAIQGFAQDPAGRPKVLLVGDVDYPPYSFVGDASTGFAMDGFGSDVGRGLMEVCDIDIIVGQAK